MDPQATNTNNSAAAEPSVEAQPSTSRHAEQTGARPEPDSPDKTEFSRYQTFAILGYILPFLFFLPLLDEKTKHVPFVRFHANQQLILLVIILALYMLHNMLFMMLMLLGYYVSQLLNLVILGLAMYGAYNAYQGKMKELPLVGQFRIL